MRLRTAAFAILLTLVAAPASAVAFSVDDVRAIRAAHGFIPLPTLQEPPGSLGGAAAAGAIYVPRGSARLEMFVDPRIDDVRKTATGYVVHLDADRRFDAPIIVMPGRTTGGPVQAVLPPGGSGRLMLIGPDRSRAAPITSMTVTETGSRVVTLDGSDLAYATTYRLSLRSGTARFTTAPIPSEVLRRGFTFDSSVSAANRALIRQAIAAGSPRARALLATVDGAIRVTIHHGGNHSWASWRSGGRRGPQYEIDMNAAHLAMRRFRAHMVWHELGHIINFMGLDARAAHAFGRQFGRSHSFRRCFVFEGECVTRLEIFAEQFAFWATGRRDIRTGYQIPPLISAPAFSRLLQKYLRLTPNRL